MAAAKAAGLPCHSISGCARSLSLTIHITKSPIKLNIENIKSVMML